MKALLRLSRLYEGSTLYEGSMKALLRLSRLYEGSTLYEGSMKALLRLYLRLYALLRLY
jgi:hypothetical protein